MGFWKWLTDKTPLGPYEYHTHCWHGDNQEAPRFKGMVPESGETWGTCYRHCCSCDARETREYFYKWARLKGHEPYGPVDRHSLPLLGYKEWKSYTPYIDYGP